MTTTKAGRGRRRSEQARYEIDDTRGQFANARAILAIGAAAIRGRADDVNQKGEAP